MKRYSFAILAALALTLTSGCIDWEQHLSLRGTGAGELRLSYTVQNATINQVRTMIELEKRLAEVSGETVALPKESRLVRLLLLADEPTLKAWFAEAGAFGITIDELTARTVSGGRRIEIVASFESLARAVESGLLPLHHLRLLRTQRGAYLLERPERPMEAIDDERDARDNVDPFMAGFKASLTVTTPSRIAESNSDSSALQTANWTWDYSRDRMAPQKLQLQRLAVEFDATAADLTPFDFTTR